MRDRVEVPALVPQLLGARLVAALVGRLGSQRRRPARARARQQRQRVQVDHLLRVTREAHQKHLIAALRALDQHRRRDRHQDPEEALAAVALPALVPPEAAHALRQQRVVVLAHQLLRVRGAVLARERAAEEVRRIRHHRAPPDRLPVHRHQAPFVALGGGDEEQVVRPVVAVHETQRRPRVGRPAVQARDEPAADLEVLRRDAFAVALHEAREELRHQRLCERRLLVEPRRRAQLRVREHRRVQACQLAHREARLRPRAARDLVALHALHNILEHECEPALDRVDHRRVAVRQRPPDARRQLAVEAHLALVHAQSHARRAARLVLRCRLDHYAHRAHARSAFVLDVAVAVRVRDPHAPALAHLPRTDPLDLDLLDRVAAQRRAQPRRREFLGAA